MSSLKAMAVVGFAFVLFAPVSAHADNSCSDAYARAQELRSKRKLIGAREALRICSQSNCPGFIVKDCTSWLDEVQASLPSVVPIATDAAGNDLTGVKVSMDGQVLMESSDGRSIEVDPGNHTFTFELTGAQGEGAPAAVKHVVVAEGEKNKRIAAIIAKPGAAVAVAPQVQVQVQPVPYQPYQPYQPQQPYVQPYQAAPRPQVPGVPVNVEGDGARVQMDSFETNTHASCVAPCSASLPPGMYTVGVGPGAGNIKGTQSVYVTGTGTIRARWVSRTGLKVGGALVLAGGIVGGIALLVAGASSESCDDYGDCSADSGLLEAGATVMVLGIAGGIVMLAMKSHPDVSFVPLKVGGFGTVPGREGSWLTGSSSSPQGGALQLSF
ncbi:MAG: hypothetical protein ACLQVI_33275 [Polyangiaceae bacterium]|jgi:hypothetical protein